MTATVRIEKADTTDYIIRITSQCKTNDGEWIDTEHYGIGTDLIYPAQLLTEAIHSDKRLIIEEVGSNGMEYKKKDKA